MKREMVVMVEDVVRNTDMDEQIREDVMQECLLEVFTGSIDNTVNMYDKVMTIIGKIKGEDHEPLSNGGIYV